MMPIRMPTIPMTTMSSIMVNPVSSSRRCIASPVRDASGPGTKVPGPRAHVTEVDRRLPGLGPAATGRGVGECVAEARLSRLVLRTGLGAEEGRDGDRDQNGNDQHHDHELDERETTLVVLTPSPQVRKHVLH